MDKLTSQLESLLFIAAKPLAVKQLAEWLGVKPEAVKAAARALTENYEAEGRGWRLTVNNEKYQLVSAPANAVVVQKFVQEETGGELSRPSLEALTIIAYRGPIAKPELDKIRGVNCSLIIRNLLIRGLIEAEEARGETYYSISLDFLRFLGLASVAALPDFERLHNLDIADEAIDTQL